MPVARLLNIQQKNGLQGCQYTKSSLSLGFIFPGKFVAAPAGLPSRPEKLEKSL